MSDINFDPLNQRHSYYSLSIGSELTSHPMKALNGSKAMGKEACGLYNFPPTVSDGNPTDNTSRSDIQNPQGQDGFGYFNDGENGLIVEIPMTSASMEDSSFNNLSQKLIQQAPAEVCPHTKMQDQGVLNSLEIESDMDIVNYFFTGDDSFFKQNQVCQPHNDVHHLAERSQCQSPIVKALVEPNMNSLGSSFYGNRIEEDGMNIVNPQKDIFSADMKNNFYLPDYDDDDDFGTSLQKKLCLPRVHQEQLPLETQTQGISQTLSEKSYKSKLPSKKVIKTNDNKIQRKVKASDMLNKQQQESFSSCCQVNTFTQDNFFCFINEENDQSNHVNTTPFFTNETLFIETKGHQLEQTPFTIPRIPDVQIINFDEDIEIHTSVTNDHFQRNEGTPISESQSNSNPSRPSPLESVDSLEEKKTSSKRPERNYLRVFVSGILKMIEKGKIGLFLDQLELSGLVTKKDVVSDLIKAKEFTTSYGRFKNAVFANYTPELIESVQSPDMLKKAKLRLVYEFIMKENYELWVHNEFAPFNFKCNQMRHEENEREKQLKRENFLNKRVKLCQKFLSCFQDVPKNLTL